MFSFTKRVYYQDTDAGGVVHHSSYIKFLEILRTEWFRSLGFNLIDLRNKFGGIFIVRKINIKYLNFANLEDLLTMNLEVEAAKKSIIILHAKIRVNNIEILRANMSLAFYNPESMKTQSLPDEIIKKIMEEF
ncbi:MAG: YbgC/FadM family acyl-CoA thioesterase [Hydrogenophilales bacterium]|jgi:acyl-CoA thioester hydrolase|tara:strand:+ start:672 stop:1070 length:399 start_codon:yes stop_codon:yes gene_type:complete